MLKAHEKSHEDTARLMTEIGRKAVLPPDRWPSPTPAAKNAALIAMAEAIIAEQDEILDANAIDVKNGEEAGLSGSFMDRLKLTSGRIRDMADGIRAIAELQGSGRRGHRRMGPAQRPAYRARAHAARRHRRDL
jgi:glutamate-5-semialdehyde dehydrogenase